MPFFSRRSFVQGLLLSALPGRAFTSRSPSFPPFKIDLSGYSTALLPREHGQLTSSVETIRRRYPSREHCMQMAAFMNHKEALLVIVNDPEGGVCDWEIKLGRTLRIQFYQSAPEILQIKLKPNIKEIARIYKESVANRYWVKNRTRSSAHLDFISVASSSTIEHESDHLKNVRSKVGGQLGVWFTQWRRYEFDRMYPDYTAKQPAEFSALLSRLKEQGKIIPMPYINGLLWDSKLSTFNPAAKALLDSQNKWVSYNRKLHFLHYACPAAVQWQATITSARNSIVDSNGYPVSGVYLDMLAASAPIVCWSSHHGHEPGDPGCWVKGVRKLLSAIDGAIMVEGCAEVYNDLIDYPLMHLYTDQADTVNLWSLVYGDTLQSVGWRLPHLNRNNQLSSVKKKIADFGSRSAGSPWMTAYSEDELFKKGVFTDLYVP